MQFYKWICSLFLLLVTGMSYAQSSLHEYDLNNYKVTRSDYTFSTIFDMAANEQSMGSVVKNIFHITTHYDAYDRFGLYEGQGICRVFCLGLFYAWGTEIDIYDVPGNKVGVIDGQVMTTEPAKFSFYDESGTRVAIASLDKNCMGFSIVDPENSAFVLAKLTRNFILDTLDNWDVVIYQPELISPRLVKIFAAFACDTQNKFKTDL